MEPIDLAAPHLDPSAFVADDVRIYGDVRIGPQAVVMFGVVIRAEFDSVSVGRQTNIQDNSVVHCDAGIPCVIGDRVTVGHAAVVHGASVGDRCLIGIGARVLNRALIGEGAWVAAGAVVPEGREIPPWTIAVGVPARPLRDLTEDEVRRQDEGVDDYLRLGATYRRLV